MRLGIFEIKIIGLDPGVEDTAIDALATAVAANARFEVVSKTELEAMISAEAVKDALGCDDVSCLAEIGAAAGVE
ncbi:MAG: hypothetical protein V3T05_01465, partial [Myxococcota bacterium]